MSIIHKGLYRDACHRSGIRIIVLFLLLKKDIFRYLFFVGFYRKLFRTALSGHGLNFLLSCQKKVTKKTRFCPALTVPSRHKVPLRNRRSGRENEKGHCVCKRTAPEGPKHDTRCFKALPGRKESEANHSTRKAVFFATFF